MAYTLSRKVEVTQMTAKRETHGCLDCEWSGGDGWQAEDHRKATLHSTHVVMTRDRKPDTRICDPATGGVMQVKCPTCPACNRLIGWTHHARGCSDRRSATALLDAACESQPRVVNCAPTLGIHEGCSCRPEVQPRVVAETRSGEAPCWCGLGQWMITGASEETCYGCGTTREANHG